MRRWMTFAACLALFAFLLPAAGPAASAPGRVGAGAAPLAPNVALGTGFTYQGQLKTGGNPHTGPCDFQFGLWTAATGPAQTGFTQTVSAVQVTGGLFTALLNDAGQLGADTFNGEARWLALAARCPSDAGLFTGLSPRQALTPAPYALFATGNWGLNGNAGTDAANFIGTTDNMSLTLAVNGLAALRLEPTIGGPNVIGGDPSNGVGANTRAATIAGGESNTVGADAHYAAIGGGQNNQAVSVYTTIAGGVGNSADASNATVGGGSNNHATANSATVAGGQANNATAAGATVGGGGWDGFTINGNEALGPASTVGGGLNNTISMTADYGVIGGGQGNLVTADTGTVGGGNANQANDNSATVAGGSGNRANEVAATVGGGSSNMADGFGATVGGGFMNEADGDYATVAGGDRNQANGEHSFAAGRRAVANHDGAWVWACDGCAPTASQTTDVFLANAENGFWFGNVDGSTAITPTIAAGQFISTSTGAYLSDVGIWQDLSDRNAKMDFAAVDGAWVLRALMGMPIESWSYRVDAAGTRHIGPTAQDFHAAFGVGESDAHLAALDTSGVALAAIQGLYTVVEAKDERIAALEAKVAALEGETSHPPLSGRRGQAGDVSTGEASNALALGLMLVVGMGVGGGLALGGVAVGRRRVPPPG